MNNDELKKKIVEVLNSTEISKELSKDDIYKFADALISAGIGDVKEAEKALEIACEKSNYCPNPSETIYNNDSECFETIEHCDYETEDCASCRNRYFLKQAEKELEEERK